MHSLGWILGVIGGGGVVVCLHGRRKCGGDCCMVIDNVVLQTHKYDFRVGGCFFDKIYMSKRCTIC